MRAEIFDPRNPQKYSIVVFSKAYDPTCFIEAKSLKQVGARVILDICDNHFYNPNDIPALRRAEEQFARMLTVADAVICSTGELAKIITDRFRPSVPMQIIADPIESTIDIPVDPLRRWLWSAEFTSLGTKIEIAKRRGATALVWFGIHGGGNADYGLNDLLRIRNCLEHLDRQYGLTLTVISNNRLKYWRQFADWTIETHYLEWRPTTFLSALGLHDIAVIPITINPFTICKSANRVALALSRGLAVVADGIPSYEIFRGAIRLDCWDHGLRCYIQSGSEREKDVRKGKGIVEDHFTPESIGTRWVSCIEACLSHQAGLKQGTG
jgi:hypothetical protein